MFKHRSIVAKNKAASSSSEKRIAPPRAPLRVMQILSELAKAREGVTLGRLSAQLKLPKTSLFSLLRSLESAGYVTSEGGHHHLGQAACSLATMIYQRDSLAAALRPVFEWLQKGCDETALLGVPSADWSHIRLVDVIEPANSLRFTVRAGSHLKLYSTSIGLVLFAYAAPAQQRHYVETVPLVRLNANTITDRRTLLKMAAMIRRRGYSISSASLDGAMGISVPVFGNHGEVVAAVGIAGPEARIRTKPGRYKSLVLEAGKQMSHVLDYIGQYPK